MMRGPGGIHGSPGTSTLSVSRTHKPWFFLDVGTPMEIINSSPFSFAHITNTIHVAIPYILLVCSPPYWPCPPTPRRNDDNRQLTACQCVAVTPYPGLGQVDSPLDPGFLHISNTIISEGSLSQLPYLLIQFMRNVVLWRKYTHVQSLNCHPPRFSHRCSNFSAIEPSTC